MRMIFGAFGGIKIGRGDRSTRRKPTPAPLCPPQNPTWQPRSRTPDRSCGKPATNRLSYGTASFSPISSPLTTRRVTVEIFEPASTRASHTQLHVTVLSTHLRLGLPSGGQRATDFVPVFNELSTTPWRRMGEWMYGSTFFWPRH
jgi:hypothetical protein